MAHAPWLSLLAGPYVFTPSRGRSDPLSAFVFMSVFSLLLIAGGAAMLLAELRDRRRVRANARRLGEELWSGEGPPVEGSVALVEGTVVDGETAPDPLEGRPAAWFHCDVKALPSEFPGGAPARFALQREAPFRLRVGEHEVVVEPAGALAQLPGRAVKRSYAAIALPEALRRETLARRLPDTVDHGAPALYEVSLAALRPGDAVTVRGVLRSAPGGDAQDVRADAGYRDAPRRTTWRVAAQPGAPFLLSSTPAAALPDEMTWTDATGVVVGSFTALLGALFAGLAWWTARDHPSVVERGLGWLAVVLAAGASVAALWRLSRRP